MVQGRPRFPRASADRVLLFAEFWERVGVLHIDGGRDFESCGWMCEQFPYPRIL